eukprot:CAMPEP_0185039312 /NCGR_PEP_ID=MMETSP1103-20130426/36043_1 /TAXON_ID=36769 /ORGANISM="Paraphysomonas bandaiensis, Strain Caron Lab Isolate" /LENGTH=736 /DNA_ID=CAMNT_0027578149 /DNA_START=105 /DNA_END=2316 /DNA_ORIENTATION=+
MRQRKIVRKVWFTIKLLLSMGGLPDTEKKELEDGKQKFYEKLCEIDSSKENQDIIDYRRKLLFSNPDMLDIFRTLWQTLVAYTDPTTTALTEEGYTRLNLRVQKALLGDSTTEEEALEFAKADYLSDVKSYGIMNKVAFMDVLSEMIEIWSENAKPRFCAAFSWALLESLTDLSTYPPKLRPIKDVRCITNIRENDILARFAATRTIRVRLGAMLDWIEREMIPLESQIRLGQRRRAILINQPAADMVTIINSTTPFDVRGCGDPDVHSIYDELPLSRVGSLENTCSADLSCVISHDPSILQSGSTDGTVESLSRLLGESRRTSIAGALLSIALVSRMLNRSRRKSIGSTDNQPSNKEVNTWAAAIIEKYCSSKTTAGQSIEDSHHSHVQYDDDGLRNGIRTMELSDMDTNPEISAHSSSVQESHNSPDISCSKRPLILKQKGPIQRIDRKAEYKYNFDTVDNSYYEALYQRQNRRVSTLNSQRPSTASQSNRSVSSTFATSDYIQELHDSGLLGAPATPSLNSTRPSTAHAVFNSPINVKDTRRRPQTASTIDHLYRNRKNHQVNGAMLMKEALGSASQYRLQVRTRGRKQPLRKRHNMAYAQRDIIQPSKGNTKMHKKESCKLPLSPQPLGRTKPSSNMHGVCGIHEQGSFPDICFETSVCVPHASTPETEYATGKEVDSRSWAQPKPAVSGLIPKQNITFRAADTVVDDGTLEKVDGISPNYLSQTICGERRA